jgi:poly(hydroxyalkanoate) depolymerase family esterase
MWQQYTYKDGNGGYPYFVYTPAAYKVGSAVPLLVMLHGCGQNAQDFATGTGMNLLAEQYGFIVVYPQQVSKSNQGLCWNWFSAANQYRGSGEPARIANIVRNVQQESTQWTIDSQRIYVAGLSAGGAMAVILGATYPDLFAAIGVHSGVEYQAGTTLSAGLRAMRQGGPNPVQQGDAAFKTMDSFARVVPTIVFHGTSDRTVAPTNGDQVIQQWMETDTLASHNHYAADFTRPTSVATGRVDMPGGYSYITATWNNNDGEAVQVYWKISGMAHVWSGGSPTGSYTDPRGPNAGMAMYQFFAAHPMSSASLDEKPVQRIKHVITDLLSVRKRRVRRWPPSVW